MTKLFFAIAFAIFVSSVAAQDAKSYYDKAIEMVQQGKAEEAIRFFDTSINLKADEYVAWYNRGITKIMLNRYEAALPDLTQAIRLNPAYKKAYLNRGTTRRHLTDYDGAIEDYNHAIQLDTAYGEAYYDRALVYDLLSKRETACFDFDKALKLGYKNAQKKMQHCIESSTLDKNLHPILRLTKTADSDTYGFTETNPVKVGTGPEGGPDNQRAYLDLLRGPEGQPLKYERLELCCPYDSKHALFGKQAFLDKYQISYATAGGEEKKAIVYISFYDYEEPMILHGFRTIK